MMYMLRQKFTGSKVTVRTVTALSPFASEFPFSDLSSPSGYNRWQLPTIRSVHSTKTTWPKWVVFAYFVAFSPGYPAIYISSRLYGAKQNVTILSSTTYCNCFGWSTDATCMPVFHVSCS